MNEIVQAQVETPHLHPVLTVAAEEWYLAASQGRAPELNTITWEDIMEKCRAMALANPGWPGKLTMVNLPLLLKTQPDEYHWWLPAPVEKDDAGMYFIYYICVTCTTNAPLDKSSGPVR